MPKPKFTDKHGVSNAPAFTESGRGWKEATYNGLNLSQTPDGGVLIRMSRKSLVNAVSAATFLSLCVNPKTLQTGLTAAGRYILEQAEASKVSERDTKANKSKPKAGGLTDVVTALQLAGFSPKEIKAEVAKRLASAE